MNALLVKAEKPVHRFAVPIARLLQLKPLQLLAGCVTFESDRQVPELVEVHQIGAGVATLSLVGVVN